MVRVLVTGSRYWTDDEMVRKALWPVQAFPGPHEIVHGDQERYDSDLDRRTGLDRMAGRIAKQELGWVETRFAARWDEEGRAAGPLRNQRMVDYGADLCLAFPLEGSRGTWDCMDRAASAGIPVVVVPADGWLEYLEKILMEK